MKGNKKIIAILNRVLGNELIAINQYFLHSRIYEDWELGGLAEHEYQESIDEMKHADELTRRILFLEGLPNLQDLGKLRVGENCREISSVAICWTASSKARRGISTGSRRSSV